MYILVGDETNRQPNDHAKFLIYGGLIVRLDLLAKLNSEVESIRVAAGYTPTDEFKFDTRARPDQVGASAATDAKQKTIAACRDLGCALIVQVSLHELIKNQSDEVRLQWAANTVINTYNDYLSEIGARGICVLDNLSLKTQWSFLAEKFSRGAVYPGGKDKRFDRIELYGATCVGAGHACSATDIVLGTFRYCVNKPREDGPAADMLRSIVPMMWGSESGGVQEKGLLMRPRVRSAQCYKDEYDALIAHLERLQGDQ